MSETGATQPPVDVDVLRIAAQMVGPGGRAIGVDMTPAMLERARETAAAMGLANVELHEALVEALPLPDASADAVISNGVIDLIVDKDAAFAEIDRVLKPGGRLQFADVVIHSVAVAYLTAGAALDHGKEVVLWLTSEGVRLALRGYTSRTPRSRARARSWSSPATAR